MKCKYCGDNADFAKKNDDGTVTYVCECCVYKECQGVSVFSVKRCARCGDYLNPAFMYIKPRNGDDFELGFCCKECVAEYFGGFEAVTKESDYERE